MSNPFDADFDAMAAPVFAGVGLADSANFRAKVSVADIPCTVLIDDAMQFVGDQSQVVDNKTTVTARLAEIGVPVRGDKFTTLAGRVLTVDAIVKKDESIVVCVIKDGC